MVVNMQIPSLGIHCSKLTNRTGPIDVCKKVTQGAQSGVNNSDEEHSLYTYSFKPYPMAGSIIFELLTSILCIC